MTINKIMNFLVNMKLIFEDGRHHSRQESRLHRLLAIHNVHYVVEQILREKARDDFFSDALHKIGFEEIIKKEHGRKNIPDYARLVELNRIRNDAEHLNIIPDKDDVAFYTRIVGDFLRWSYKEYFQVGFDSIIMENGVIDGPIRDCLLEAKSFIQSGDISKASRKMYEALGAFKFMMFGYLSDFRVNGQTFEKSGLKIDFPNLLADLAFKILLRDDEVALQKLMSISSKFSIDSNHNVHVTSVFPIPPFKDANEARTHYDTILNIILSHQDKIPASRWRGSNQEQQVRTGCVDM